MGSFFSKDGPCEQPVQGAKEHGFTLVELMITLAVAAILFAIAGPSYRTFQANNRATSQANLLLSALNFARSEAINQGTIVTICPKSTASVTSTTCGSNADWANGWHAFTDASGAAGTLDGTDVRVHSQIVAL